MKIAIVLPSLHGGGAERQMLHLADGFIERGHEVVLILRKAEGPLLPLVPEAVRVVDLNLLAPWQKSRRHKMLRKLGWYSVRDFAPMRLPASIIGVTFAASKVGRALREEQPDVVLSAMTITNITTLIARRLAGLQCRVIVSERNTPSSNWRKDGPLRWLVQHHGARLTYPWADVIVAVSHGVADDLAHETGLDRSCIGVIYNPTVTPEVLAWSRSSRVAA